MYGKADVFANHIGHQRQYPLVLCVRPVVRRSCAEGPDQDCGAPTSGNPNTTEDIPELTVAPSAMLLYCFNSRFVELRLLHYLLAVSAAVLYL